MSIASEFKEFAVKGNVIYLAVGVIIGGAFGKIVDALGGDLVMPVVGLAVGGLDVTNHYIQRSGAPAATLAEARKAGAVLAYGSFITVLLNFAILALIIFVMIRQINRLKRQPAAVPAVEPPPPATPEDVLLLREIRDSLRRP